MRTGQSQTAFFTLFSGADLGQSHRLAPPAVVTRYCSFRFVARLHFWPRTGPPALRATQRRRISSPLDSLIKLTFTQLESRLRLGKTA
jgi:hypothetical protein